MLGIERRRPILIIGNYVADQQQSMIRFANLLVRFYEPCAPVWLVQPPSVITRFPGLPHLARKYLAYIDKLLLFPLWLTLISRFFSFVHIADHSNAFYSFFVPRSRCIITCHDLLAVRGAMGDPVVACEASPIGIWLQRMILAGLRHANAVAFDSEASLHDYLRLVGCPKGQRHKVIPIPLNAPFTANSASFQLSAKEQQQLPAVPYLLMVGSALPRKNRILGLQLLLALSAATAYQLVFAGAPPSPEEQKFISQHHLSTRVHVVERPSHALINQLYCDAHALLFPSLAEGFGWPLLEAQACDCPVIASNTTSIPEVAGSAALYADPFDVAAFARHVRALEDPNLRANLILQGRVNLRRFDHEVISRAYTNFALQTA